MSFFSLPPELRRESREAVRLAAPIVLAQLGMMLMGTVDVMMLGHLSEEALAASGVGNAVAMGLSIFPTGILMALDALASQAFGARETEKLSRYFKQALILAFVLALPISFAMWEARPLLLWLRQPAAIVDGGSVYLRAVLFANLPMLLYVVLQRILQAMSIVRPVVMAMVVANVANLFADYGFIFGRFGLPALGVEGAGWATTVSRWVAVIYVLIAARHHLRPYWRARTDGLWRLAGYVKFLVLGGPIGLHISFEMWIFMVATFLMGQLGSLAVAGHQVAINLAALAYMMPLGLAGAAATRVGNAVGRRDMPGARRAAAVCLGLGVAIMATSALIFLAFPRALARLYTPDAPVIALAAGLLPIAAFFAVFDGVQTVCSGILRGAGDTRIPAGAAFVGYWLIALPAGAWMTFRAEMGAHGIWWGLTLGLASAAVLLAIRVALRFRGEIAILE